MHCIIFNRVCWRFHHFLMHLISEQSNTLIYILKTHQWILCWWMFYKCDHMLALWTLIRYITLVLILIELCFIASTIFETASCKVFVLYRAHHGRINFWLWFLVASLLIRLLFNQSIIMIVKLCLKNGWFTFRIIQGIAGTIQELIFFTDFVFLSHQLLNVYSLGKGRIKFILVKMHR